MSKKNIHPALFERGEPHWGHGRGEDVGVLKDLILEADGRGARVLPQEAHEIHGAQPVVPDGQPRGRREPRDTRAYFEIFKQCFFVVVVGVFSI